MKTFKDFLARARHFSWDHDNDLEHHDDKKEDRRERFSWDKNDLEHHKDQLKEYTHDNPLKKTKNIRKLETKFDHDQFREHKAGFNDDEQAAFRAYKIRSKQLNTALRQKKHDNLEEHHVKQTQHLDHVTSHRIHSDMTLFRGGLKKGQDHTNFPVGHEFTDHGYTSTAVKHLMAREVFANRPVRKTGENRWEMYHKPIVHVIHAPKGTKGHFVDVKDINENGKQVKAKHPNSDEDEFILHRGTRFKVTHHSETDDAHYIHSKIISQRPIPIKGHKTQLNLSLKPPK